MNKELSVVCVAFQLRRQSIDDTLAYATALAAYVTTQAGANPVYKITDLNRFIWKQVLKK